jgi:hypothetical protein
MSTLPGSPLPATIWRAPRAGGQPVQVLGVVLRTFMGVTFQPEQNFQFQEQQGGSVLKRHVAFADWPEGVTDPIPIHPGDILSIPWKAPAISVIQVEPAPTRSTFQVEAGYGPSFQIGQSMLVNGKRIQLLSITGDLLRTDQMESAPPVGAAVQQADTRYGIDDAGCYQGHHMEIYVRVVPRNA